MLDQRALSGKAGTAQLSMNDNSELNELVRGDALTGSTETLELLTLDSAMSVGPSALVKTPTW